MIWLAPVVALAVGLAGTALMRHLAPRIGLLDAPDGVRKFQTRAIPLGGGLAVYVAILMGTLSAIIIDPICADDFVATARGWWAFLAAATIILIVGLLDDWYELIARYKLVGQLIAALVFVLGGDLEMRYISFSGHGFTMPPGLAEAFSVVWLLFAINSLNLLDGMDGLLAVVGGVVCLAMGGVALITEQHLAAAVAFATAAALLGFLRYNWPPASIYLGDCGSMLVGLIIGALCIKASLKSHAVATLVPICVLVLPFLDTTAAVIRRKLSGRSMAHADREHLHHVLLRRGWSVQKALLVVAALGGLAGAGAVASVYFSNELIGLSVSLGIVAVLVGCGLFGAQELQLVRNKMTTTTIRVIGSRRREEPDLAPRQ